MMPVTLTYDPEANALYLHFSDIDIAETLELSESAYVDVDANGEPVGFEILHAESSLVANLPRIPVTVALKDLMTPDATRLG